MRPTCTPLRAAAVLALTCMHTACVGAQGRWFDDLLAHLRVPSDFRVSVFTDKVPGSRTLALSPNGIVYSTDGFNRVDGRVYGCRDQNGDGDALDAGECWPVTTGYVMPNGLAFLGTSLYIALIDRIIVIRDIDTDPTTIKDPVLVLGPESSPGAGDGMPTYTHHGWRYMTADPVNQKLAVAIGAPCNVPWTTGSTGGEENCAGQGDGSPFPLLATIATLNPDGSDFRVVARGVRNSVGITYHPTTQDMWFTENGRDQWGSSGSTSTPDTSASPPDELNRLVAPTDGETPDYGFPECYGRALPDTALDGRNRPFNPSGQCDPEVYIGAIADLPSHAAALGLRFYNQLQFPERYHGRAFIAEHGSWNRDPPSGFVLATVDVGDAATATASTSLTRNTDATYEEFMSGFRLSPKVVCTSSANCPGNSTCQLGAPNFSGVRHCGGRGRPADVEVMPDGSILLSDSMNGLIFRVEYVGDSMQQVPGAPSGLTTPAVRDSSYTVWTVALAAAAGALVSQVVARACRRRESAWTAGEGKAPLTRTFEDDAMY